MTLTLRFAIFAGLCGAVALVNLDALRALYAHSMGDETASHAILIPLVSGGLLFLDRKTIFRAVQTSAGPGGALLLLGLGMTAVSRALPGAPTEGAALSLAVAAPVTAWIGAFVLLFGASVSRASLFPLLFLYFTVPFPPVVVNASVQYLKDGSTELVALLFRVTGTPFFREAYVFALPTVTIEVADACSGIRSSIALVLTSLLAGHMYLDTPWKKAVLVLAVLPLSLLKNGIRIVTLSLLSIHVDPSFLTGQLHHDGGIVFFLLTLAIMAPLLAYLMKSERRRPAPREATVL